MVLMSEYDEERSDTYKIYLETFPFKIYNIDLSCILDSAYENSKKWIKNMYWIPRKDNDSFLLYFAEGGKVWITDAENNEHELTRECLVYGIREALKIHKNEMIDSMNELNAPCFSESLCDEILQKAIFNSVKF